MGMHTSALAYERKNDDAGALPVEIKNQFASVMRAIEESRAKYEAGLIEAKKGFDDVVRKEEVARIDAAVAELKTTITQEIAALKRLPRGGVDEKRSADQVEHSKTFEDWFRKGSDAVTDTELRTIERKALAGTSDNAPSGGFTVRPEMESQIDSVLKEVSPIRSIASVRQLSTGQYKKLVNQHGVNSGWVTERQTRAQTLSPDLVEVVFTAMELYAMPAATQELLDDSAVNIDQWISDEVTLEFAAQEGNAFVMGDGVNKPRGIIGGYTPVINTSYAWGNPGYIKTGAAAAFASSDNLVDLFYAIKAGYRANAQFMLNRKTMGVIRKFKDGQGNYLADLRLRDSGLVETILGKPVIEAEDMPDVAANAFPVAYGDFRRGYLIVDRVGIRTLRDPYTAKPYVLFYTTKRVGGGIQNFEAIKLIKCEA